MKPSGIDKKSLLANVLHGYKPISEAPQSPPWDYLGDSEAKLEAWLKSEGEKDYKAIDSAGNVYLIKNPIVAIHRQIYLSRKTDKSSLSIPVKMDAPKLAMSSDLATAPNLSAPSVKGSWGGNF